MHVFWYNAGVFLDSITVYAYKGFESSRVTGNDTKCLVLQTWIAHESLGSYKPEHLRVSKGLKRYPFNAFLNPHVNICVYWECSKRYERGPNDIKFCGKLSSVAGLVLRALVLGIVYDHRLHHIYS